MKKCRRCGCTDDNACLIFGVGCFWVEADLCSACATMHQVLEARGGLAWVLEIAAMASIEAENELLGPAVAGVTETEAAEIEALLREASHVCGNSHSYASEDA